MSAPDDPYDDISSADLDAMYAAGTGDEMPATIVPPEAPATSDAAAFAAAASSPKIVEDNTATVEEQKSSRLSRKDKAPKEAKPSRSSRKNDDSARPSAARSVPAATSFDFLDGAYAKARKLRMMSLSTIGIVLIIAVVLTGQGVSAMISTSNYDESTKTLLNRRSSMTENFDKLTTVNGVPQSSIEAYIAGRTGQVIKAASTEADVSRITDQVLSNGIPGVTIVGISFAGAGVALPNAAPTTTPPETVPQEGAQAPAGEGQITIVVTGTVANINTLEALEAKAAAWFTDPPSVDAIAGGESAESYNFTMTAVYTLGESARITAFRDQFGLTEADAPASAPAASTTTVPTGN